jgi:hypothetical protein
MVKRLLQMILGALLLNLALPTAAVAQAGSDAGTGLLRDTYPLTGFQLMIAGIVAVVLVGGGILLRRLSRPRKR